MKKGAFGCFLTIMMLIGVGICGQMIWFSFADSTTYDMYEYRPLIVGKSLTFEFSGIIKEGKPKISKIFEVVKKDDYNGTPVKVVKQLSGWLDYFEESEEGIKRHKHIHPEIREYGIYYPPAIQYPRYIKIGDLYERENVLKDFSLDDDSQIGEEKEHFTFKLLGEEDVKVPLGEYKDCLKSLAEWKSYDENGHQTLSKWILAWDAKGVGTVKIIYLTEEVGQVIGFSEGRAVSADE